MRKSASHKAQKERRDKKMKLLSWLAPTCGAIFLVFGCSSESDPTPLGDGDGDGDGDVSQSGGSPGDGDVMGDGGTTSELTLAEAYADYFPIGTAIGQGHLTTVSDIVEAEFNHLTAENDMKASTVQPTEGNFNFTPGDAIADVARAHGMKMTGHALLWHRQAPSWFFSGMTAGDPDDIEVLKGRLKAHIDAVVGRYADVVDNWDVVNEAISDDGSKTFRDGPEGSKWYEIFDSEEYIYFAFQYAYDALEALEPGSAAGKLYYNDYNMTLKVDRVIPMLDAIRDRGVPVDGVGLQAHYRVDWPSISEVESTINKLVAAGYKVKISELDLSLYNDYPNGSLEPAPEIELTPDVEANQATAYANLFALFRTHAADITSVTLWGVSDETSWLNNEPVSGRKNYPLLWNAAHEPKQAYFAVRDF